MRHSKRHPRLRAAAAIFRGNQVLLVKHRKKGREYWLLPGGGVEYGETLSQAVQREIWEETRLKIKVQKLVLVHDSIPADRRRHILNVVFQASITSGKAVRAETGILREVKFIPLTELKRLTIYPVFLKTLLPKLKKGILGKIYTGNSWND